MQLMQYRAVKYPRIPRVQDSKQHLLVYRGVEYIRDSLITLIGNSVIMPCFSPPLQASLAA